MTDNDDELSAVIVTFSGGPSGATNRVKKYVGTDMVIVCERFPLLQHKPVFPLYFL